MSNIINLLNEYKPLDNNDNISKQKIINFVRENTNCFSRSNLVGHITGSAWLVSPDNKEVLLTHHKKLNKWIQLGGHADGDNDILQVALKEAQEESGIYFIKPISSTIFDLDVHEIPEHKGVPKHIHYDIRFTLKAPHKNFIVSEESYALAWVPIQKLIEDKKNVSINRMAFKWFRKIILQ